MHTLRGIHLCPCLNGILLILWLAQPVANAAEDDLWRYCAPDFLPSAGLSSPNFISPTIFGEAQFSAEQMQAEGDIYTLQGDVIGGRRGQEVMADRLIYNEAQNTVHAEGNVRYQDFGRILFAEQAQFQLDADSGQLSPARLWLSQRHLRGQADHITLLNEQQSELDSARFTTCPTGNSDWYIRASTLELDAGAGEGVAYNASVHFMHVPIFYTPYLSFPLTDQRKTGFLIPTLGGNDESGTELTIPYYWNIAPQYDATIVPRIMSKRGILWDTQFRYLHERNQGEINLSHIAGDEVYDDDRTALNFEHQGNPAAGWSTSINYNYASDEDYLDDFGDDLNASSTTHLEQTVQASYRSSNWQSTLRAQNYQTLDDTLSASSEPYKRLPQLLFSTRDFQADNGLTLGFSGEWVDFDRDEGVIGRRLDLQPSISWPLRGAPGFLVPTLKYRYTQYDLERADPNGDATTSRQLPLFSVDSGLVFERDLAGATRAAQQTLEPRLYYLYVPYRDQDDLIVDENGTSRVFDTSLPAFTSSQMFRDNRFSGADRVGDANQLSAMLTTRFFDLGGRELISAGLGRIVYFEDREVTLPGRAIDTRKVSNWVGDVRSEWLQGFSSRATVQWDSEEDRIALGNLDMRYYQDARRVLRVNYRFTHETQKQIDMAAIWPIADQWSVIGRRLYSILDDVTLEAVAGVEYETCCWTLRFVNRRHRNDVLDPDASDSFWVQLELKGLTSVGRRVEDLMKDDILAP